MASPLSKVSDRLLLAQVTCRSYVSGVREGVRRSARQLVADERGQTPTEYLMIVGLMAAVVVVAFTIFFWPTIKPAVTGWSQKAATAITGSEIQ